MSLGILPSMSPNIIPRDYIFTIISITYIFINKLKIGGVDMLMQL